MNATPERLERRRAATRKWQEANREKAREASRRWAKNNKEYLRQKRLERYQTETAETIMFNSARVRARRAGVPFAITVDDIQVPTHCPVLGIELCRSTHASHDNSPSLDRIVPELGYVPGNIAVISIRANRIKNNGTAEEHERIADWMRDNDPRRTP